MGLFRNISSNFKTGTLLLISQVKMILLRNRDTLQTFWRSLIVGALKYQQLRVPMKHSECGSSLSRSGPWTCPLYLTQSQTHTVWDIQSAIQSIRSGFWGKKMKTRYADHFSTPALLRKHFSHCRGKQLQDHLFH